MKKMREKLNKVFQGRYGMDELGKTLMVFNIMLYVIGAVLQSELIFSLSIAVLVLALNRMMSRQHWDRREENRRYTGYTKLWKLRYENRKHSRIFMCKRCGKYIRVPKGKGKIQVTCTACGNRTVHRT